MNVSLDEKYLSSDNKEELEDLLVVAMNNLLVKVGEEEAKESQNMISEMLPPGIGNLFGG